MKLKSKKEESKGQQKEISLVLKRWDENERATLTEKVTFKVPHHVQEVTIVENGKVDALYLRGVLVPEEEKGTGIDYYGYDKIEHASNFKRSRLFSLKVRSTYDFESY